MSQHYQVRKPTAAQWGAFWMFIIALLGAAQAHAQQPRVTLSLSQNPFPAGQQVTLVVALENLAMDQTPAIQLPDGVVQAGEASRRNQLSIVNGVQTIRTEVFVPITAVQPGDYKIAPQPFQAGGQTVEIPELSFKVLPADQMPADAQDQMSPLLRLQLGKTEFYQGEIVPITATLYMPRGTQLQRMGLIDVTKDSMAIQRFPQGGEQSSQVLGGISYDTLTFRSSLSALKAGKLKVGPAKMEIIYGLDVTSRGRRGGFGFFGVPMEQRQANIAAPAVSVNILPLPTEGKPAQFSGAVGRFAFAASAGVAETTVGDPVPVDLSIEGEGNFDAIQPPVMVSTKGWKSFPARKYSVDTPDPNTADLMNRKIGYSVTVVPEAVSTEVPSFEFAFFNPEKKQYEVLRSAPMPIKVKPGEASLAAAAPVESAGTVAGPQGTVKPPPPLANISDILTTLSASPTWATMHPPIMRDPRFLAVNVVFALGFAGLIAWALFQRWRNQEVDLAVKNWRQALAATNEPGLGRAEFYRRAARCVQLGRVDPSVSGKVQTLLEKYETLNFGIASEAKTISSEERSEVLNLMKGLEPRPTSRRGAVSGGAAVSVLMAGMVLLGSGAVKAAGISPEERYADAVAAMEKKNFAGARQAAETLAKEQNISPEVFQLAGNAAYREGQPGIAAMWYQRAMMFPAPSAELRQNLRHVQEKIHVLSPPRDEVLLSYSLMLSKNQWSLVIAVGVWLAVFSLALLILGARGGLAGWVTLTLVVGLLAAGSGIAGLVGRPSYDEIKDLVFVSGANSQLRTAASVTAGSVIVAPSGSIVKKVLERGEWTYLEAEGMDEVLRGWLPTAEITPFWPYDPAKLP